MSGQEMQNKLWDKIYIAYSKLTYHTKTIYITRAYPRPGRLSTEHWISNSVSRFVSHAFKAFRIARPDQYTNVTIIS